MRIHLIATTTLTASGLALLQGYGYPIATTSHGDLLGEFMGRECYKSHHRPNPATATNPTYHAHIQAQHHTSIYEHVQVTFYVEGGSRSLLLELERHGFHSFSVESQRFVDTAHHHPDPTYHPTLTVDQRKQLDAHYQAALDLYRDTYRELRALGYAVKAAREAARVYLPNATPVDFGVSANLRAWREFLVKREAPGADREMQELARQVHKLLRLEIPNSMTDLDYLRRVTDFEGGAAELPGSDPYPAVTGD